MSTTHEDVTLGPAEGASDEPERLLELAVRSADQLLVAAREDAERIVAAARADADQILAGAHHDADQLQVAVEELRARIGEDVVRLRQSRWARHEQLPAWLTETDDSEAG